MWEPLCLMLFVLLVVAGVGLAIRSFLRRRAESARVEREPGVVAKTRRPARDTLPHEPPVCAVCGTPNPLGARFCRDCGASLRSS